MSEIATPSQLRQSFLRYAAVVVPLVLLLGTASGQLAGSGSNNLGFAALNKPAAMPPGWVFGVAWTILYVLMGLALAMILHARRARGRSAAIALFAVQLALNLAWSPIFFAAHRLPLAVTWIGLIFLVGLATTIAFGRIRQLAAWLLVPYLAWLCFAGALSYDVLKLNPNAGRGAQSREVVL